MRRRSGLAVEWMGGDVRFTEAAFCSPHTVLSPPSVQRTVVIPAHDPSPAAAFLKAVQTFLPAWFLLQLSHCGSFGTSLLPGLTYTCECTSDRQSEQWPRLGDFCFLSPVVSLRC